MEYYFLFDYDGVLIHKLDFAQSLADRHGLEVEKIRSFYSQYLQKCLKGELDMIDKLQDHLEDWEWKGSARRLFDAMYLENISPNVLLIQFIRENLYGHFPCHIATNQDHHRYMAITKDPLSQELFGQIFSSSELGIAKPSIEYFEKIYAMLLQEHPGLKKDQIIFVDDILENVDSAKQFGLESHQYQTQEDFERFLAPLIPHVSN